MRCPDKTIRQWKLPRQSSEVSGYTKSGRSPHRDGTGNPLDGPAISRHTLPSYRDPDVVIVPYRLPISQRINPKVRVEPNRVKETLIPNRSLSGSPLLE